MLLRIGTLPDEALAAAAQFHAQDLPCILQAMERADGHMVVAFPPADHTHRAWRLAVVQGLAREHVPLRINAVEGDSEEALAAAVEWLGRSAGVTGQYWPLDATGADGA